MTTRILMVWWVCELVLNKLDISVSYQIDETVVLDKQSYLMDKNAADEDEESPDDKRDDLKSEEAEEVLDAISNEGNEAEEKLEHLKENLNKEDDALAESEQ